ncbi:MAG: alginate export family protein [Chitinophagales bacterium]|nr:alginate export family protein [Chitinophagales bacterium]
MKKSAIINFLFILIAVQSYAQFNISGQILNRSEYRHGFGTLVDSGVEAGFSIGQRSRLNATYQADKVKFGAAIQDIRTWGNTSQIKITDGFQSLHEAWMDIQFHPKFSAKIGRQELDYDDARFLGNLDWALQARAHDIALLKYSDSANQLQIHGGFAYNQTGDFLTGTYYNQANQYKIAQMLWLNKKWDQFTIGFLMWNNGMQSDTTVTHNKDKVNYTSTIGIPVIQYKEKDWTFRGFFYYQFGWDQKNKNVAAFDANAEINYSKLINETKKNKISLTGGFEYISGTSQIDPTNTQNNSFNPLYGTNHRHNGYMDYFYVGGRHINSVGLMDGSLRCKYDINPKVFLGATIHYFNSAADIRDVNLIGLQKASSYLGTELDLTAGYLFSEAVSFQGGYSQMFGSESLQMLRGGNKDATQNWAYLAILFRPEMKNRFTGLKW